MMSELKEFAGMNDSNLPGGEKKKTIFLHASLIALAIIVVALGPFLAPISPGISGRSSAQISQMGRLTEKIGDLESEVRIKQSELFNLLEDYKRKTGESPPALNGLRISEGDKRMLKERIAQEKNASLKALLMNILERGSEIAELKTQMNEYETLLPPPRTVTGEESHYQIAMEYLMKERGVKKERAFWLVERTVLFEPMISGFRVWNFYSGDEFRTFVTQGNADISPAKLKTMAQQYLIDLNNKVLVETERLTNEINRLTSIKEQLDSRIDHLREREKNLRREINSLFNENLEMQRVVNSLFFMVGVDKDLIKKGIIKDAFLGIIGSKRLKEISPEFFNQYIDLRKKTKIEIKADEFNLSKIKNVTLHPGFYKKDTDYKIETTEDKKKAIITILAIDKFRSNRVVISIR
jgi:hypothetical protein